MSILCWFFGHKSNREHIKYVGIEYQSTETYYHVMFRKILRFRGICARCRTYYAFYEDYNDDSLYHNNLLTGEKK